MKIHTKPIFERFAYDASLIPEHGTPLFDRKNAQPFTSATVRFGARILTPKQVVYILHQPSAKPSDTMPNPTITLPRYIINKDKDADNIRIENLKGSDRTSRWEGHHSTSTRAKPIDLMQQLQREAEDAQFDWQ